MFLTIATALIFVGFTPVLQATGLYSFLAAAGLYWIFREWRLPGLLVLCGICCIGISFIL